MREGKHSKKKFKIIEVYSVLILIAALFMSIGYAEISGVIFNVEGEVLAAAQSGVFITNITYVSDSEADTENSQIKYFTGTMFESEVKLGDKNTSSITYEITMANNVNTDYVFIGVLTDTADEEIYSNNDIVYSLNEKIKEYTTIIPAGGELKFQITFKYADGITVSNNSLTSKLNFRFKEVPKLVLSNEGETYTLNDIYPDYTPQEYKFTVSNYYSDEEINGVPMSYSFVTTIDSPLTAKIYDETGAEVTKEITIAGDGTTKISHTYTLKIIWDNTNGSEYNSPEYASKDFKCNVALTAIPNGEDSAKYEDYKIEKQFNVNGKTASFNFNPSTTAASLTIKSDVATLDMTINNYSSDTDFNKFNTSYEISIQGNSDFSFNVNDVSPTNNVITRILSGGSKISDSLNVKFMADMANLDVTETLTLKMVSKTPYVTEIEIPITINLHTVKVTLNANGGSVSPSTITVYQDKTYSSLPTPTRTGHTFNGWFSATSGGTKYTTTTTVTTTATTQTLYAQWTSHLLADYVSVGDHVNYPVSYSNVATNADGGYIPSTSSTYKGWRVLSVEGSGDSKYVRLVTAGIPMTYKHPAGTGTGSTSVTALTTNFFSTSINSTATNYKFRRCGFVNSSGTTITTISALKTLFTNDYTQLSSSGVPKVQSMTKADVDKVWGATTENGDMLTSNNLLAIPSQTSGSYAAYHLGSYTTYSGDGYDYLWNIRYVGGIIFTNSEHGVRPVVTLKSTVLQTGQDSSGIWQIDIE